MKSLPTVLATLTLASAAAAEDVHVRPDGPVRTLSEAQREARKRRANVVVHAGTYYLPETLVLTADDSGTEYRAADGEPVVISGGRKLDLAWESHKGGVLRAATPAGLEFDQLFVNGKRQVIARYPNYDPAVRPFGGFAADAFGPARAARWADPTGGIIHAMHAHHWGGFQYRITGKTEKGEVTREGGWQNNRQSGMHPQHRFVENVFEELDAPGEWFHDAKANTLYYLPPAGVDLKTATVEVAGLRHLVEFRGSRAAPVRNVTLRGFVLRHTARTFMDTKEPLLRSDWTVYRGGAVLFDGAEDCALVGCEVDQPGGNGVFVSGYNRRVAVRGCDVHDTGASGVAIVGHPKAVRNPLFEYGQRLGLAQIDKTPGPKTDDYPADCVVEDSLIRRVGVVEKQAAGVQVSMAAGVTVRHCSVYEASRAGINVSEGTFGGHVVEFCDVFDTVLETGDHGSFNSWGRDRYWGLKDAPAAELPALALLDAVKPTVLRNNRWRCDHGWDVDLDDGSSNYEITSNLFLHGGLKLREGFRRKVWNNVAVNNTLHPHVWYDNCGDEVSRNIWAGAYRPAGGMPKGKWGAEVDRNLFTTTDADRTKFAAHGCDAHSAAGDPRFVDPATGDYRVKDGSPALALGFVNFPMDRFGVVSPGLRAKARTPEMPSLTGPGGGPAEGQRAEHYWLQARVRPLEGEEFSAFGVSKESGGLEVVDVPEGSPAARWGFRRGDLVQAVNGQPARTFAELTRRQAEAPAGPLTVGVVRDQRPRTVTVDAFVTVTAAAKFVPAEGPSPVRGVTARPGTHNDPLATLTDNSLGTGYGPVFANGTPVGVYRADLGSARPVTGVTTWSHNLGGQRGPQRFVLYGSAADDPGWDVTDRTRFVPIAEVDTRGEKVGTDHGTVVRDSTGAALGTFRWLAWAARPVTDQKEHTAFQEFQVTAGK